MITIKSKKILMRLVSIMMIFALLFATGCSNHDNIFYLSIFLVSMLVRLRYDLILI